jgi:hypothetical protein
VLALGLALLCGEVALQTWFFLLAWELAEAPVDARGRLRALAPTALLVALYLVLYKLGGYGAHGHGYVDLLAHPGDLAALWAKPLLFVAELLVGVRAPREGWQGEIALALLGAAALALLAGVLLVARRRLPREAAGPAWLWLGGLFSLLPILGGKFGPRLLLVPSMAAATALSAALLFGWAVARGRVPAPRAARALALAGVAGGVALHLVWAPLARVHAIRDAERDLGEGRRLELWRSVAAGAELERAGPGAVVLLTTPSWLDIQALRCMEPFDPDRKTWWDLSLPFSNVELTRIGPRSVAIRYEMNRRLLGPERARRFAVGDLIETRLARIRILERQHGWPSRVEVEFFDDLDGDSISFAAWQGGRLVAVEVPALAAG